MAATLTACAMPLLGAALNAAPAHADSGAGPVVTLSSRGPMSLPLPADDWSSFIYSVKRNAADPVKDLTLSVDYSGIASFAVPSPYEKCKDDVCTTGPATMNEVGTTDAFGVKAAPGAKEGQSGKIVVSGTTPDGTVQGFTETVTVTGTKKIVVGSLDYHADAAPGSTIHYPLYVGNAGSDPAQGVEVTLETSAGLSVGDWSNCTRSTGKSDEDAHVTVCDFDTTLEPGTVYKLASPLPVAVADTALNERYSQSAALLDGPARPAGDHPLTLVPAGPVPGGLSSSAFQYIAVDNVADLAALGSTVTGKPGSTVDVTVGLHNNGPASANVLDSDDQLAFLVNIPKGTTTTAVPKTCSPFDQDGPVGGPKLGRTQYVCEAPRPFDAGRQDVLTFTLKIAKGAPALTTGKVKVATVYGSPVSYDKNSKNDTASITVHVTGGTVTGGTGSGSTGGSTGVTGSGSSAAGGAGNAPAPQTTGGTGGNLADTGFNGAGLAGVGGALVVAGAGAFLITRRIRNRAGRTV